MAISSLSVSILINFSIRILMEVHYILFYILYKHVELPSETNMLYTVNPPERKS